MVPCHAKTLRTLVVIFACACASLVGATNARADAAADSPPNIVVIVADDLGWTDLGSFGSDFYETPNIDRLAERGMRFTSAYAACQVCSPTRAALLTGQNPARIGITDYIAATSADREAERKNQLARNRNYMLLPAPQRTELPADARTFADAFSQAGYHTFFLGKWHVGDPENGFGPTDHGFDVNIGGTHRGGPYGRGNYFHPFDLPNIDSEPGDHLTDRTAEEAVKLIDRADGEPFLMLLSFYDVHTPLQAKDALRKKYQEKAKSVEHDGPRFKPEPPRWNRQVHDHAIYAAMIEVMDDAVGTVMEALEQRGLDEDTIIIFTSDNGGLSTSEGHPTSNLPLRAGKGWIYEGGIRIPTIIRWPGVTEPGSASDVPIISHDFFPTMLEMANLPPRENDQLDGVSLVPLLQQAGDIDRDALYWHYPHYGNQGSAPSSAIRHGDWKLIEFFENNRLELYNLADDLQEQHNLADDQPDRTRKLHEKLQTWRDRVNARYPSANDAYDPATGRKDAPENPPG